MIYRQKLDSVAYISAAESTGVSSFFNHYYVIRPESYRIRWNYTAVRAITPFKVTDFGTNRKLVYDFLLVINSNVGYLLSCTVSEI